MSASRSSNHRYILTRLRLLVHVNLWETIRAGPPVYINCATHLVSEPINVANAGDAAAAGPIILKILGRNPSSKLTIYQTKRHEG